MDQTLIIIVSILASITVAVILTLFTWKRLFQTGIKDLVQQVVSDNATQIAQQSKQILQGEKDTISAVMDQKQQAIERLVDQLQKDMHLKHIEMRKYEEQRIESFATMSENLQIQQKAVDLLQLTTQQLTKVLSNNQARGEWGERIIEDLLRANGLVENIHYSLQTYIPQTQLKPDVTLLLPDKKYVAVDVKFPYMQLQKATLAKSKQEKEMYEKAFEQDVRKQVDKVAQYIVPENGTVQYALLFVPNELIFSFINQQYPYLVDHAMKKRVLLVSPFTFLVVARTVIECYRNFMLQDSLKDIYQQLTGFVNEWGKFTDHLHKYGSSIDRLQKDYESLTQTRVRQMDKRIKTIEALHTGVKAEHNLLEEPEDPVEVKLKI